MPSVICQSDKRERKASGTSLFIDWRLWRTRGSEEEEEAILRERATSMTLTKREGGRRVTPSFSSSCDGKRSGRRERASGPERSFPGTWIILRSKSLRSKSQRA